MRNPQRKQHHEQPWAGHRILHAAGPFSLASRRNQPSPLLHQRASRCIQAPPLVRGNGHVSVHDRFPRCLPRCMKDRKRMRLAVLKERRAAETRVAATPDTVKRLIALDLTVAIEAGAGLTAAIPDAEFAASGAEIAPDAAAALAGAGIVFAVQAPLPEQRAMIQRGALLVCTAGAFSDPDLVPSLAAAGIDTAAMELLPRITRAQSMDVLSSQANLAGYRAVVESAGAFLRGFPMMMTAAGTVPPARVFVIGAGVAGLQAIATARRLGAIVSATDVRPAAKEEIKSLGATFIGVEDQETAGQTGAYAREMSEAFRQKQAELMAITVARNDIIICTALVMGRRAPTI